MKTGPNRSRPADTPLESSTAAHVLASDTPVEVSVVIPCLNEARTVGACIKKAQAAFQEAGLAGEVVVADNGSTDGSAGIAEQLGARVVYAPVRGYGSALRKGIEEARGAFVIMGDADGSHDFSEIPRFVEQGRKGYQLVLGNRFRGNIKPGAMSWHHKYIGNPVLTAILNLFFGAGIGDVYCGMRGFSPELYRRLDLRTTGMEFAVEFVLKAAKARTPIAEVPVTVWPDQRGRPPHMRTFRDGWRTVRLLLLCAPNWLFLMPGGWLMACGLGVILWLLPGPECLGPACFDSRTMLFGTLLALLGFHIISIGLFAKLFSFTEGLSGNQPTLEKWLKRVKLEHGLAFGTILTVVGFAGDVSIFWQWASAGFGQLPSIRGAVYWSLCLFLGIEIIFSSFFLSMLGISRGTYIGDRETS
jgi:hypothetical protein